MNTAFLMKLGFQLLSDNSSLWTRILMGKYKHTKFNGAKIKNGQRTSSLWRAVVNLKEEVQMGMKWAIANGKLGRFWKDAWLGDNGPLINLAHGLISEEESNMSVNAMAIADGKLNWGLFSSKLPCSCFIRIGAVFVKKETMDDDRCFWQGSSSGLVTVKSAYQNLDRGNGGDNGFRRRRELWSW